MLQLACKYSLGFSDITVELNLHSDIVAGKFPRIKIEPVVGDLYLISIHDFLLEDPIPVSKAVAPSG